jgi:diadenylate cyclase
MNSDFIHDLLKDLPPFSILVGFELLILAGIVIGMLLFLRQAGAAQFLVWLSILGAAYLLGRWAGFVYVPRVIEAVFPYFIFASIVLFQAEIRRGLAGLSRNPFRSRRLSAFEARHLFEDILMAVNRLSAQQIGALIVVEREASLRNYAESGVPLQARLTQDLLATIFQPGAPLHDGAAIIRRDRVIAAACFLPLTVNPVPGQHLGTRHRAAIGITEETDALAIVVSEQTGLISLAQRGSLEMGLPLEMLGQRLMEAFGQPVNPAASAALSAAARSVTLAANPDRRAGAEKFPERS